MLTRRTLFGGLALLAAPAIIRTPGLLMPVKVPPKLLRYLVLRGEDQFGNEVTESIYMGHYPHDPDAMVPTAAIGRITEWQLVKALPLVSA